MSSLRHPRRAARRAGRGHRPRAFTLIELLIVIVIIGILVSVAITVASRVTTGGRTRLTEEVLKVCDQTLTAAAAALEARAPSRYVDTQRNEIPIVDGRDPSDPSFTGPAEPTAGLYFLAVSKVKGLDEMFKGLDAKVLERSETISSAFGAVALPPGESVLTVRDGFGQPIRYVTPAYHGGHGEFFDQGTGTLTPAASRGYLQVRYTFNDNSQVKPMRRSYRPFDATQTGVGDADEGLCTGGAPYFYSVGPDGDPGQRADNVYTTRPTFPLETQRFGQ